MVALCNPLPDPNLEFPPAPPASTPYPRYWRDEGPCQPSDHNKYHLGEWCNFTYLQIPFCNNIHFLFWISTVGHFERILLRNHYLSWGRCAMIEFVSGFVPLKKQEFGSWHVNRYHITLVSWEAVQTDPASTLFRALNGRTLCKSSSTNHSSGVGRPHGHSPSGS